MSETVPMTIADFLLARYAEDEAVARDLIAEGPWNEVHASDLRGPTRDDEYSGLNIGAGRVLAECEAKRRIVELHGRDHECSTYDDAGEVDNCAWVLGGDCSTMRLLALPFADHPDYRAEEWTP